MMNSISTLFATGFGIGNLPAPGTCGTLLLGLPAVFLLQALVPQYSDNSYQAFIISISLLLIFHVSAVRIISCALPELQTIYGVPDPQVIVLDEVVGFLWVFVGVPLTIESVALGFALFRLFDITKFWFIGWSESLPGALGIVADDALAGIAARIVLQLIFTARNI